MSFSALLNSFETFANFGASADDLGRSIVSISEAVTTLGTSSQDATASVNALLGGLSASRNFTFSFRELSSQVSVLGNALGNTATSAARVSGVVSAISFSRGVDESNALSNNFEVVINRLNIIRNLGAIALDFTNYAASVGVLSRIFIEQESLAFRLARVNQQGQRITQESIRETIRVARELSKESNFQFDTAGILSAQFPIASGGFTSPADQRNILTAAQDLTTSISVGSGGVSNVKLKAIAETLTQILSTTRESTAGANKRASQLALTDKLAITTPEEFTRVAPRLVQTAVTSGVSVEDAFAAFTTLTRSGLNTADAKISLENFLDDIVTERNNAEKLGLTGLTVPDENNNPRAFRLDKTALRQRGLTGILRDIQTVTQGSEDLQGRLFGNMSSGRASRLLSRNIGETVSLSNRIENVDTQMVSRNAQDARQTTEVRIDQAVNRTQMAVGEIGQTLSGSLSNSIERVGALQDAFVGVASAFTGFEAAISTVGSLLSSFAGLVAGAFNIATPLLFINVIKKMIPSVSVVGEALRRLATPEGNNTGASWATFFSRLREIIISEVSRIVAEVQNRIQTLRTASTNLPENHKLTQGNVIVPITHQKETPSVPKKNKDLPLLNPTPTANTTPPTEPPRGIAINADTISSTAGRIAFGSMIVSSLSASLSAIFGRNEDGSKNSFGELASTITNLAVALTIFSTVVTLATGLLSTLNQVVQLYTVTKITATGKEIKSLPWGSIGSGLAKFVGSLLLISGIITSLGVLVKSYKSSSAEGRTTEEIRKNETRFVNNLADQGVFTAIPFMSTGGKSFSEQILENSVLRVRPRVAGESVQQQQRRESTERAIENIERNRVANNRDVEGGGFNGSTVTAAVTALGAIAVALIPVTGGLSIFAKGLVSAGLATASVFAKVQSSKQQEQEQIDRRILSLNRQQAILAPSVIGMLRSSSEFANTGAINFEGIETRREERIKQARQRVKESLLAFEPLVSGTNHNGSTRSHFNQARMQQEYNQASRFRFARGVLSIFDNNPNRLESVLNRIPNLEEITKFADPNDEFTSGDIDRKFQRRSVGTGVFSAFASSLEDDIRVPSILNFTPAQVAARDGVRLAQKDFRIVELRNQLDKSKTMSEDQRKAENIKSPEVISREIDEVERSRRELEQSVPKNLRSIAQDARNSFSLQRQEQAEADALRPAKERFRKGQATEEDRKVLLRANRDDELSTRTSIALKQEQLKEIEGQDKPQEEKIRRRLEIKDRINALKLSLEANEQMRKLIANENLDLTIRATLEFEEANAEGKIRNITEQLQNKARQSFDISLGQILELNEDFRDPKKRQSVVTNLPRKVKQFVSNIQSTLAIDPNFNINQKVEKLTPAKAIIALNPEARRFLGEGLKFSLETRTKIRQMESTVRTGGVSAIEEVTGGAFTLRDQIRVAKENRNQALETAKQQRDFGGNELLAREAENQAAESLNQAVQLTGKEVEQSAKPYLTVLGNLQKSSQALNNGFERLSGATTNAISSLSNLSRNRADAMSQLFGSGVGDLFRLGEIQNQKDLIAKETEVKLLQNEMTTQTALLDTSIQQQQLQIEQLQLDALINIAKVLGVDVNATGLQDRNNVLRASTEDVISSVSMQREAIVQSGKLNRSTIQLESQQRKAELFNLQGTPFEQIAAGFRSSRLNDANSDSNKIREDIKRNINRMQDINQQMRGKNQIVERLERDTTTPDGERNFDALGTNSLQRPVNTTQTSQTSSRQEKPATPRVSAKLTLSDGSRKITVQRPDGQFESMMESEFRSRFGESTSTTPEPVRGRSSVSSRQERPLFTRVSGAVTQPDGSRKLFVEKPNGRTVEMTEEEFKNKFGESTSTTPEPVRGRSSVSSSVKGHIQLDGNRRTLILGDNRSLTEEEYRREFRREPPPLPPVEKINTIPARPPVSTPQSAIPQSPVSFSPTTNVNVNLTTDGKPLSNENMNRFAQEIARQVNENNINLAKGMKAVIKTVS